MGKGHPQRSLWVAKQVGWMFMLSFDKNLVFIES